jgi:hypothetical protein
MKKFKKESLGNSNSLSGNATTSTECGGNNTLKGNFMEDFLSYEVPRIFGCTIEELSDACWEVITKSNDYFRETKGRVVSLEKVFPTDRWYRYNFGVVPYEVNYAIGYQMFNRDGSECGTTVYWTSLGGGLLCHGTNAYIKFKTPIKTTPCVKAIVTTKKDDEEDYAVVYFGGNQPTIEEKARLIELICKREGISWNVSIQPIDIRYTLLGDRSRGMSATRFIKALYKGRFTPKKETSKRVVSLRYLGKGVTKYHPVANDNYGVYKVTYADKSVEYKKLYDSSVCKLVGQLYRMPVDENTPF